MKKSLIAITLSIFSLSVYSQTTVSLNLLCPINGEITAISANPISNIPIKNSLMSVLVENGVITTSDSNNYFVAKIPASIENDRIFGWTQWADSISTRKLSIEINRNTGMVRIVKESSFTNPFIESTASASGVCEKLANRRKF
jgi:hypothetical protein